MCMDRYLSLYTIYLHIRCERVMQPGLQEVRTLTPSCLFMHFCIARFSFHLHVAWVICQESKCTFILRYWYYCFLEFKPKFLGREQPKSCGIKLPPLKNLSLFSLFRWSYMILVVQLPTEHKVFFTHFFPKTEKVSKKHVHWSTFWPSSNLKPGKWMWNQRPFFFQNECFFF